jgi:hypothetical protein
MLLHNNCINCTFIAHLLHISSAFRTFIGHIHLPGDLGNMLKMYKRSSRVD